MKIFTFIVSLLFSLAFANFAYGQTVHTFQDNNLNQCAHGGGNCGVPAVVNNAAPAIPNATYTGVFSVANPQYTFWIQVNTKRTVCYDIALTDANNSITSIDMLCWGSQTNTPAAGAGFRIPVYTSTAATGITTSTTSTIRQVASGGGAPGTSSWSWCVTNIPSAFIHCGFQAQGVVTAVVDTLAVDVRGIIP